MVESVVNTPDPEDDIHHTGNAPTIPRREVIEVLNQVQMLQTHLLILLNRYQPTHHEGTESRPDATIQDATRTSHSGGSAEQPVVYTFT